jgi:hypothetical protein
MLGFNVGSPAALGLNISNNCGEAPVDTKLLYQLGKTFLRVVSSFSLSKEKETLQI